MSTVLCFGGFLGMTIGLRLALLTWGYSATDARLYTASFSIWSTLCRALVGIPPSYLPTFLQALLGSSETSLLDNDVLGGAVINSIGSILVFVSALAIATMPDKVSNPAILLPNLLIIATGLGVCCAATGGSEVHTNKMAHIRVPRHASKVLMMSLVGQTAKSIHG